MASLTSPLLRIRAGHDADPPVDGTELAALIRLAGHRGAETIAIGTGRTPHALAAARSIQCAWEHAGGHVLATVTWPETGASWLRQATRFAAAGPDLWVMTGPATGWAQMTRRLLWSSPWDPSRTLTTAGIGDLSTLNLVGLSNLHGLTGTSTDGSSWHVGKDGVTRHPAGETTAL